MQERLAEQSPPDILTQELTGLLLDAAQLDTALVNLAVNARDAMPGHGKLTIVVDEVTAHGLRATASTFLNESGLWNPDAIERAWTYATLKFGENQVRTTPMPLTTTRR